MPYLSRSAMNPGGQYQMDALDQIGMNNAQMGMRQQQLGMNQAQDDLMAQIALRQLQSGDNRFNAELADRQAARGQGRQDAMNMFAAQADLTKAGWGHEDARRSSDLASQEAIARLMKEPSQFQQKVYGDQQTERQALMKMLGLGGDTAGAPMSADPYSNSTEATARPQGPAAPSMGGGVPALDQNKLQAIAAYTALTRGTQLPDFSQQAAKNELTNLSLEEARRNAKNAQIADENPVSPEQIAAVIGQKLPQFIDDDTSSAWSRAIKGAGGGATVGAGAGAAAGGIPTAGIGAIPGAVIGGAIGGVGGAIGGALSGPGNPSDQSESELVQLWDQLVKAYSVATKGNVELAKQLAKAKIEEIAKTSSQKGDYLTDWDADKTRDLFSKFQ